MTKFNNRKKLAYETILLLRSAGDNPSNLGAQTASAPPTLSLAICKNRHFSKLPGHTFFGNLQKYLNNNFMLTLHILICCK